jgi:hypothetical protein
MAMPTLTIPFDPSDVPGQAAPKGAPPATSGNGQDRPEQADRQQLTIHAAGVIHSDAAPTTAHAEPTDQPEAARSSATAVDPSSIERRGNRMTTIHRIDLEPARRQDARGTWIGQSRAFMSYQGERIGESSKPLLDAARILLDSGRARPDDRIVTWRGKTPCLSAPIAAAARLTIDEPANGNAARFRRWMAFSRATVSAQIDETESPATHVALDALHHSTPPGAG